MGVSLSDELASLKIDRGDSVKVRRAKSGGSYRRRGGFGLRLLSWMLWLVPLSMLGAGGVIAYRNFDQVRSRPEVSVGVVERMTTAEAEKLLSVKGYLKSRYQAMIGTKLPGRVEKMCVEEGMRVKKGDTLAILEHNDLKAMLAAREAQTLRTEAELDEARADLWEKERDDNRVNRLYVKKSVTSEEHEKALAGHKKAEARVAALEAGVKLMKANVQETKAIIATMHLYAPFDGTVVEKQGEEGEVIATMAMNSSTGRTAVVTIANLDKMDVEADINEGLMVRVGLGQPAEVSVSAVPKKRYRGRLRQVVPMGDRTRGTVKVKVEILDPDEKLFPELAATVYFLPSSSAGAVTNASYIFVPKSAVFEENGHDHAWVVDAKNTVHRRSVEVATTTDALARVESGLKEQERVVLNPLKALREGMTVRVAD
jgi:RND family efflux transporter MFP subunit